MLTVSFWGFSTAYVLNYIFDSLKINVFTIVWLPTCAEKVTLKVYVIVQHTKSVLLLGRIKPIGPSILLYQRATYWGERLFEVFFLLSKTKTVQKMPI